MQPPRITRRILGQAQLTARGVKLAAIIDIADPSAYTQIAMAE